MNKAVGKDSMDRTAKDNNVVAISADELLLETASQWVLAIDEGLSDADEERLGAWLAEDPRHTTVFMEVAGAWDKLDSLSRLAGIFPMEAESRRLDRSVFRSRLATVAAAASVAIAAFVVSLILVDQGAVDSTVSQIRPANTSVYETAIGEQSTVLLADGSLLTLNTNSELRVAYTDAARVLNLVRGEMHISVAEDTKRPLSVIAGDRIIQAVGTAFRVEIAEENRVEVLVTEGKVVVGVRPGEDQLIASANDSLPLIAPPVLSQNDSNTLDAGESMVLGVPVETVTEMSVDEIEVQLSWKEGRLIFKSKPLAEALTELERYTTVEFVIVDDELKTRTLSGRFRAGDVDAFLASLKFNFNIEHRVDPQGRILLTSL